MLKNWELLLTWGGWGRSKCKVSSSLALGAAQLDQGRDHILFSLVQAWKPHGKVGKSMAVLLSSRPTGSWEDCPHMQAITPVQVPVIPHLITGASLFISSSLPCCHPGYSRLDLYPTQW